MLKPDELIRQMAEQCEEDLKKGPNRITADRIELWMHRAILNVREIMFDSEDAGREW